MSRSSPSDDVRPQRTVTSSIGSALDRGFYYSSRTLIETDASMNRGNFGGPLVDSKATSSASTAPSHDPGLRQRQHRHRFAIPIDNAARIADRITQN